MTTTPRHARAAAEAARTALAALERDPTSTAGELEKARRTFRAAHSAWLDAALEHVDHRQDDIADTCNA